MKESMKKFPQVGIGFITAMYGLVALITIVWPNTFGGMNIEDVSVVEAMIAMSIGVLLVEYTTDQ